MSLIEIVNEQHNEALPHIHSQSEPATPRVVIANEQPIVFLVINSSH